MTDINFTAFNPHPQCRFIIKIPDIPTYELQSFSLITNDYKYHEFIIGRYVVIEKSFKEILKPYISGRDIKLELLNNMGETSNTLIFSNCTLKNSSFDLTWEKDEFMVVYYNIISVDLSYE